MFKIAVLEGDGIGPEVIQQTLKVFNAIEKKFGYRFEYEKALIGGISIDKTGYPLTNNTIKICLNSDAILFGSIGHPKYDKIYKIKYSPEYGLLKLRKEMGVYCNIRPIKSYLNLIEKSPLKNSIAKDIDILIYRELIGGIYFGKKGRLKNQDHAYDYCTYSKLEIERIANIAFKKALKRNKKIHLIDKANVLETSKLWREVIKELSIKYPEVNINFMYVDNAAMQIIINPKQFDIILTENMFGDILSDEASAIVGSIGLIPSASIGEKTSIFEPIHGSYPEAAGKNIANPIGSILSGAMLLDHLGLKKESQEIYNAVNYAINNGIYTRDINSYKAKGTNEIGNFLYEYIINNRKL